MPDKPWERRQHVLIGQLNMFPVCKWSLFLGKDLSFDTALSLSLTTSRALPCLRHGDWKDLTSLCWELIRKGMPLKLTPGPVLANGVGGIKPQSHQPRCRCSVKGGCGPDGSCVFLELGLATWGRKAKSKCSYFGYSYNKASLFTHYLQLLCSEGS